MQNLPEESRQKITNYLKYNFNDARSFITFASDESPGALLGVDSNRDNIFDALRSNEIVVSNFFWDSGGEMILDKKDAQKVIRDNLEFIKIRLGLPAEAKCEDIEKVIFKKLLSRKIKYKNTNKYQGLIFYTFKDRGQILIKFLEAA